MKHILIKTYNKMFSIVAVSATVIISYLLSMIMASLYKSILLRNPSLSYLQEPTIVIYALICFLAIAGIFIWMIVVNTSTGLFASEEHEGTLRLLIAKPVARDKVFLAKTGGMILGAITYLVIMIVLFTSFFALKTPLDKDILVTIIQYMGVIILYGTLMIVIAGGFGMFLSTHFKKKVPGLLILTIIGLIAFGVLPIIRMYLNEVGLYESMKLYIFDINYHFGLIYNVFIKMVGEVSSSPNQLDMFSNFTGLYRSVPIDPDVVSSSSSALQLLNKSLNGYLVMFGYTTTAVVAYVCSLIKVNKKDI